ncbi:MAG: RNase H1/viroplasmin domain-containing protein [Christensenellaceae bacterium]|jgi:ribonuclease HI|nr:RNase H1/viroplasmin domain-containing protein [Christensenellaceae bacterium]
MNVKLLLMVIVEPFLNDSKLKKEAFAYLEGASNNSINEIRSSNAPLSICKYENETESSHKYFAVKNGYKTGILNSWADCQLAIRGYNGAEYKSFKNESDALAYLNSVDAVLINEIIPK